MKNTTYSSVFYRDSINFDFLLIFFESDQFVIRNLKSCSVEIKYSILGSW